MKKKPLIIILLCLLVCVATWTIAEQWGVKRADTETPGTSVIQSILPLNYSPFDFGFYY